MTKTNSKNTYIVYVCCVQVGMFFTNVPCINPFDRSYIKLYLVQFWVLDNYNLYRLS